MKCIILMICLILQAFLNFASVRERYYFFDHYLVRIKGLLTKINCDHGIKAVAGILLPILLLTLILNLLFGHSWLLYLIYGTLILYFCLDIQALKKQLSGYFTAVTAQDIIQTHIEAEKFIEAPVAQDNSVMKRAVTETIFTRSLTQIFSVIFWFFLLGPFGAVLYYIAAALNERAKNSEFESIDYFANYLKEALDWIPVRLVTLTYALIGHFGPVFALWIERLAGGLSDNHQLLLDCGLTALDVSPDAQAADPAENHLALNLVWRTLWTWVIAIAVLYVTAWLF